MAKLCDFGKEIKKKLVDIDKTQNWLIEEVRKDSGLYFDSSYMNKIMTGKLRSPRIIASIHKVLNFKSGE